MGGICIGIWDAKRYRQMGGDKCMGKLEDGMVAAKVMVARSGRARLGSVKNKYVIVG